MIPRRFTSALLLPAGLLGALLAGPLSINGQTAESNPRMDWPQFRGPSAQGKSDAQNLPLVWSDSEGIAWKTALPGPGASSPIVVGDRIFLTCHTGYADGSANSDLANLKRHVLCLNLQNGTLLWNTPIPLVVATAEGISEIVVAMFRKLAAYEPETGCLLWHANTGINWHMCPTPLAQDGIVHPIESSSDPTARSMPSAPNSPEHCPTHPSNGWVRRANGNETVFRVRLDS